MAVTMPSARPDATEYAPFYANYVAAVPEADVVSALRESGTEIGAALSAIPESRGGHRYADGKWSIRELVVNVIDAERIFTYRALRIARGDATPLPGFDENRYVAAAGSDARAMADLLAELLAVRAGTTALFTSLPDAAWRRVGVASEREISVRALAYVAAGHVAHHLRILRERYGVA
jgi:hypothetical protein